MYSHKVLLKHVEMNPFQVMVEDLKVYAYVGEEKKSVTETRGIPIVILELDRDDQG